MPPKQDPVDVPRPRKWVTFGLIILALLMPWLALYLDGASWPTIGCNFAAWLLFPIVGTFGAIVHAIICLFRSKEHRKYSKPARRRLRYDNNYSAEKKVVTDPEPAPITRAVTEPPPAPAEEAPTEPPAAKSSASSSSTSVSSSDVEKEDPAIKPPPKTATAKKEDDPPKDPAA
ncbi:hypothetical protein OPT61_g8132 [Boeremia exigua]|uniref:Uncharacterized protein n=1 Tax=Boeremia exigua TaxID=749465 RepID=A0ACC2I066_9PLEO|nr:hypothetical protein OPT61_g8132 [Boeremia exigua]